MLWLTGATGQEVRTSDGTALGRVVDLTVRLGAVRPTPLVTGLLVDLDEAGSALLDWTSVLGFEHDLVEVRHRAPVRSFPAGEVSAHLASDELLLRRDVLDTQIVDVVGHRLARVADVALARTARGELEVLAVEVAFGRVLERLGLGRLGGGIPDSSIAWTDLHCTSDRGHLVQLATPASAVHRLTDGDLAALVARLDLEAATEVLDVAGPARACCGRCPTRPAPRSSSRCRLNTRDAGAIASTGTVPCGVVGSCGGRDGIIDTALIPRPPQADHDTRVERAPPPTSGGRRSARSGRARPHRRSVRR
ncbi:MAG: hypothetical protein EBX39_05240 [Actinobacteria bacterium]|nr:hypothetical protein [Actinomycetota bacterium]